MRIKDVDRAINKIVAENRDTIKRDGFIFIRIQEIAKKMHRQYWKYREEILDKIHLWAKEHPYGSIWESRDGIKFSVGYGQQMSPVYGTFFENKDVDMLELYKLSDTTIKVLDILRDIADSYGGEVRVVTIMKGVDGE